ncbi:Rieske 2Fe-2S domain-containing protein [Hyphococcus luteus]|uniref:Rieske (2Fe-2S) protein n=1 Tax=Hyphococcus luteus TaxID=2058213 RepID=A0A2S7KAP8_9PROT|nr:Rieske 2Fe-2S domain-containing protein [Marinicaulis flavus]PQA89594.1 Rieske (2Fe-2S) protein [Marinicaulis flavus]
MTTKEERNQEKKVRPGAPLPPEGEGGFSQSWYPICLSAELEKGAVKGVDFLDGRVVAFRGQNGQAKVMSAYCPHVGADLSVGEVIGDNIRCAFHYWEYDQTGQCVKTGPGDPPPKMACLFQFPTVEKFGIVWAFNGKEPLWELPDLTYPEDELEIFAYKYPEPFNCDPWVFAANTPDMQHIKVVHGVTFGHDDPHQLVEWSEYGLEYNFSGVHGTGAEINWDLGIRGTTFFWRTGTYDGWWLAAVTGFSLPKPGMHEVFGACLVRKGDDADAQMETAKSLTVRTVGEDKDILNTIHYRQGTLTKADKSLARYLKMVRNYPRAHPSEEFIK